MEIDAIRTATNVDLGCSAYTVRKIRLRPCEDPLEWAELYCSRLQNKKSEVSTSSNSGVRTYMQMHEQAQSPTGNSPAQQQMGKQILARDGVKSSDVARRKV